jgi:signal peptidase II
LFGVKYRNRRQYSESVGRKEDNFFGSRSFRYRAYYVVDMFDIQLFDFAVFNVADICITVAEGFMIVYLLLEIKRDMAKKKAEKAAAEVKENE